MSRPIALVLGSLAAGGVALSVYVGATTVASLADSYAAQAQGTEPAAQRTFAEGPNPPLVDLVARPSYLSNGLWESLFAAWGR